LTQSHSKHEILVVDDTLVTQQLIGDLLEARGYRVRLCADGLSALEAVAASPPDLILLDIAMPKMNGYEVCIKLKMDERFRDIPIIFLSAYDEVMDKVMAFNVGGADYISKPFQIEEVLARIRTHIELHERQTEVEQLRVWERNRLQELNAIKDDLLRIVSHDLKNPLGTISNALYLLRETYPQIEQEENARRYLSMIEKAGERMLGLVTDLLDIATIEGKIEVQKEPVPFKAYLRDILDEFLFGAQEKDITLDLIGDKDLKVPISPQRFGQVVRNLLSNALKYSDAGGQVTVRFEVQGNEVHLIIHDTGLGIPADDLPHIFERFYRVQTKAHLARKGTGLGMTIVQMLVEQHRGRIWVESEVGVGSTFTVALPL
jgi:signal transduction histidine kinase